MDQQIEAYWQKLILTGEKHSEQAYRRAVELAQQFGFSYKPIDELKHDKLESLVQRMAFTEAIDFDKDSALFGTVKKPELRLSNAFDKFLLLVNDRLMNKSEGQIRKWKNPRIKAIRNLINLIGDKTITELTRDDIIQFRDWWVMRIKDDNLTANSANKDIGKIKDILDSLNEHYRLRIDLGWLFSKTTLKEGFKRQRLPFDAKYLRDHFLNPGALSGLNEQARYFLYAMAETGARGSELVELKRDDILLQNGIPHINIHDRKTRKLKTPFSNRTIPLVGYAQEAFENCPDGFTSYRDRFDSLSNLLNKYLKHHELLPTKNHSVYSLRHSFQDRLTSVNAPDRVQAQLMGHKFNRPEYGKGASLELKKEWMDKVCLKKF